MRKCFFRSTILLLLFSSLACQNKNASKLQRFVNIATWSNYLSQELVEKFEKKTGIQLRISNYSSNEELLAKLQAGAAGYDVAVPSDYMLYILLKLQLLHSLDYARLSHAREIEQKYFKRSNDPKGEYSIPYVWGTTGLAVNRSLYSGKIKNWRDFFQNKDLSGKISLLDDAREVIGAALKSRHYSLNSKNLKELQEAKELLLEMRSRVKTFTSEPLTPLLHGEIAVAHIFMSDALKVNQLTHGKIEYFVPEEGGTFWLDSLVIPRTATHILEAHELINFLLSYEASTAVAENFFLLPVHKKALLPFTKFFPSKTILSHCEIIQDLGDSNKAWDRAWIEIKLQ